MLDEMKTAFLESTKKFLEADSNWFSNDGDNGACFIKTHEDMEDYTCVRITMDRLVGLRDYLNTVIESENSIITQEEN